MALRFCKGKYIINEVTEIDYKYFDNNKDGIVILRDHNKLVGYMDSSLKKYSEFAFKENVFRIAHLLKIRIYSCYSK